MFRKASIFGMITLFLGLLCVAGVFNPKAPKIVEIISLRHVHAENHKLAPAVKDGSKKCPDGYELLSLPITDFEGKLIGKQPILVSIKSIVSVDDVERATGIPELLGRVSILLTKAGGDKVRKATSAMTFGVSQMAVVVEGKCLIAPVVQETLGRNFEISGLDGKEEVDRLVKAINQIAKAK